ncbi:hypothetical protein D3C72_800410 [compost metagenome]
MVDLPGGQVALVVGQVGVEDFDAVGRQQQGGAVVAADDGTIERRVQGLELVERHFGQLGGDFQVDVAVLLHRHEVGRVAHGGQRHRVALRVGDDVLDGLQLGHVVAGFAGHVQGQVVRVLAGRFVLGHGALHRAFAPVVGRQRQVPVALHLKQLFQIVQRGVGRRDGIAAFVAPPVLLQVEVLAGGRHELPQARGLRARQGGGVVGAFHEGQQRQFRGQATAVDFVDDEVQVLARALGHALNGLGVGRVVVGPLLRELGVQVGDGETAADAVPGVARRVGQVNRSGRIPGDVTPLGIGGEVFVGGFGSCATGEDCQHEWQKESG